jgi:putative nucleotidyltransferase with HDIG domain
VTPREALDLLADLGASPWLVRHHELVLEAAILICDQLTAVPFDRDAVLVGAALHDAGKIVHPEEMSVPGSKHEAAGRALLRGRGVPDSLARFCVTHAAWDLPECTLEDRLVALADKLWKGKRDAALEQRLVDEVAVVTRAEPWEVFDRFDAICEAVATDGPDRLARSDV